MMNQTLPQISNNLSVRLEALNLLAMLSVYQDLASKITNAKQSPLDYLEELTRIELEQRNQKHIFEENDDLLFQVESVYFKPKNYYHCL